jgi:tetratricopeptide (TPR) repeat protein
LVRQRYRLSTCWPLIISLLLALGGCAGTPAREVDSVDQGTGSQSLEKSIAPASASLLQSSRDQRGAGNYAQASASLERALRIEPEQPLLWLELGRVRLLEGDYDQAEQLGRKARTLSAGNLAAEDESEKLISDALRAQGRYHDAYLNEAPND